MKKQKINALRHHLKTVGKFARQRDALSLSDSPPVTLEVDPCQEQQMAFDGALADIDSAVEALDAALIVAADRMGALDTCRFQYQN